MILFLGFDGVLHSTTAPPEKLFCKLPLLEEILREFSEIKIVINSSWRYYNSLNEIRAFFTPDIAERVIGVTPFTSNASKQTISTLKEDEILAYLQQNNCSDTAWLALDDLEWLFPCHYRNLICCLGYKGIDAEVIKKLKTRLTTLMPKKLENS